MERSQARSLHDRWKPSWLAAWRQAPPRWRTRRGLAERGCGRAVGWRSFFTKAQEPAINSSFICHSFRFIFLYNSILVLGLSGTVQWDFVDHPTAFHTFPVIVFDFKIPLHSHQELMMVKRSWRGCATRKPTCSYLACSFLMPDMTHTHTNWLISVTTTVHRRIYYIYLYLYAVVCQRALVTGSCRWNNYILSKDLNVRISTHVVPANWLQSIQKFGVYRDHAGSSPELFGCTWWKPSWGVLQLAPWTLMHSMLQFDRMAALCRSSRLWPTKVSRSSFSKPCQNQ